MFLFVSNNFVDSHKSDGSGVDGAVGGVPGESGVVGAVGGVPNIVLSDIYKKQTK
jgi:hypothetical protein